MPVGDYHSLAGLLVHLLFLAGMRRSALYQLFAPLSGSAEHAHGPATLVNTSSRGRAVLRAQLERWAERLRQSAWAPLAAAVAHHFAALRSAEKPSSDAAIVLRSDAALDGARTLPV